MDTESELLQKRLEVKQEILSLKGQIPSARILDRLGKTFKHNSLGYWLSNVVLLNLILLSPWGLLGLALNEIERTIPLFTVTLLVIEGTVFGLVVAHIAVQNLLDDLAKRIVEKISNVNDLSQMLLWFQQTWSVQNVSAYALPFGLIWLALGVPALSSPIQQFIGYGLSLSTLLVGLLTGIYGYYYVWTCLFISHLKEFQYEMNVFSPADSEILSDISEMLTKAIYVLAGLTAVLTLLTTSNLIDERSKIIFGVPMLLFGWTIIVIQFVLTRSTLSAITNRAKWATLNRIRMKINTLEAAGDLSDKDTAERLFRLADIHKQIMASKSNTLDLKSFSTLFSQLMLPLLGLFLGNIDKVLKFLP
jgi:hypothetical protein